jgi:tetratricopeptide (TPR) repeat protein
MDDRYAEYRQALKDGHLHAWAGRLAEAAEAYRLASELAPDRALPLTSLAGVLDRLGEPAAARAALERALVIDPANERARRQLAALDVSAAPPLDEPGAAGEREVAEPPPPQVEPAPPGAWPAADLVPTSRPEPAPLARFDAARPAPLVRAAALEASQLEAAASEASADLTADADTLTYAAACYARLGRIDAALDLAGAAVERDADNAAAHELLLELYLRLGFEQRAADKARLLARLYELEGRPEDAARVRRDLAGARGGREPSGIIPNETAGPAN